MNAPKFRAIIGGKKDMPGTDAIDTAIAWLRSNGGEDGESERCAAVADWIESEEFERYLRKTAREAGVPVARLRRRIAEQRKTDGEQP